MTAGPTIRDACPDDRATFAILWEVCLRLHGMEPAAGSAAFAWDLAFRPGSGFGLRVAADGPAPIDGFALHGVQVNSWTGRLEGHLDTLFVTPDRRGGGIGRALLEDVVALGRSRGWQAIVWHVRADNGPARMLYDRYAREDGYRRYRLPLLPPPG